MVNLFPSRVLSLFLKFTRLPRLYDKTCVLFLSQHLDLLPWFYVYLLDFGLYNNLIHYLASSSFCSYVQKNRYTTSSTHGITANSLWFTTLGGNYLWLVYLQLNSCHARHTIKGINLRLFLKFMPLNGRIAVLFLLFFYTF